MDLDHLRLFLHVVDAGSVSAAARVAHLSQPAVSRNLALLQEAVGADLFERQGRGLVLTPAGRALVPRARALLDSVQAAVQTARRAAERGYEDLRMGAVDSVASYLVPRMIEPVRARFPELQWKLRTARSAALLEQVEAGALDLAVVASSGRPRGERAVRLAGYRLQFFGRKDLFPDLAKARSEDDLAPFPIVEIETLAGQGTLIRPDAKAFAIAHSLGSVKALVLAGFGIGAMMGFMLAPDERERLVHAAIDGDPDCGLWAVLGPERREGRGRELEAAIVSELQALAAPHAP